MKIKVPKQEVFLCCGGKGCPVVRKGKSKTIEILDDFGGKVRLSLKEAAQLPEALKELSGE